MAQWEQLVDHPNYEICCEYPHEVRNASTQQVLKPRRHPNGYVAYNFGHMDRVLHHRLIASQWIPNPDNLQEVDHIDRDPANNHIENLRWITRSSNNRNKRSHKGVIYEWVDQLPDDALVVDTYTKYRFNNYHYAESTNTFYFFNGDQYRLLKICTASKDGHHIVHMMDTEGHMRCLSVAKFKRIYGLIMA
jgi:hypothetical protein